MEKKRKVGLVKAGIILAGVSLMVGVGSVLFAQEPPPKVQNVVSIDALGLAMGVNVIEYERVVRSDMSLSGQVRFLSQEDEDWKVSGFGLFLGIKKYFKKMAPEKFWWGPSIGFISVSATDKSTGEEGSGTVFSGLLNIGYKWLLGERFTIEPSAGIASYLGSIKAGEEEYMAGGLGISLGLTIGYAF